MLDELYCPDFVTLPLTGTELFVGREDIKSVWEAAFADPSQQSFKIIVQGVEIIENGTDDPLLLEVGESVTDEVSNYSVLYGKCDDSGEYKIIVDTWLVYIAKVRHGGAPRTRRASGGALTPRTSRPSRCTTRSSRNSPPSRRRRSPTSATVPEEECRVGARARRAARRLPLSASVRESN